MEAQMQRPLGHHYEEEPQNPGLSAVIEGEDEQHHEKKSVLKKVKAKARKIKDTLTKHGHGHDQEEYDQGGDEEDEDEEMVEDPEVPVRDSAAVRSAVAGQGLNVGGNLERSSVMKEDRYDSKITDPPIRPFEQRPEAHLGEDRGDFVPEEDRVSFPPASHGTKGTDFRGQEENLGQPGVKIGGSTGMEVDPHAPKDRTEGIPASNYQTKVTDPTGKGKNRTSRICGEEAGITPILRSFDKMSVYDDAKLGQEQNKYTGSHDQSSPGPNPNTIPTDAGNPKSGPKSFDASNPEDLPRDTTTGTPTNEGSYVGKISSATSAIAGKAVSAKNVVASKLGFGGGGETGSHEKHEGGETAKSASPTEFAHKIAATVTEKLAPVYEKVADTGSSVISKVPGIGAGTGTTKMETESDTDLGDQKGPDKGVSVKEYFSDKLRPGDEDKALSEVISDALHKRKEETGKDGPEEGKPVTDRPLSETISQAVSDAFHKREDDPERAAERKQMGKVTESEEVARTLGTGNKEEEDDTSREIADSGIGGNVGVTSGVVGRVKGAVTSWFGKGDPSHASQESTGTTYAAGNEGLSRSDDAQDREIAGERRLQESGN
ncbi:hypothetical protein RJ639_004831 [Escallonia herrerae]|uniref:Uncharacterized protein n=1 Tax=Escallonia herrerae TaxID=1293975 RepID=A0AA89AWB1_9ASTE|nr:hypothetical protein RJ639_004831 [Escallonia herrerae]